MRGNTAKSFELCWVKRFYLPYLILKFSRIDDFGKTLDAFEGMFNLFIASVVCNIFKAPCRWFF